MLYHVIRKVIQSESSVQTDLVCSGTWAFDEKWAGQTVGDWLAGAEHHSARVLPPTSLLRFLLTSQILHLEPIRTEHKAVVDYAPTVAQQPLYHCTLC